MSTDDTRTVDTFLPWCRAVGMCVIAARDYRVLTGDELETVMQQLDVPLNMIADVGIVRRCS